MILPILLGHLNFPFKRLVRSDPARQMPARRSHILHLGIINKSNLCYENSSNALACLLDLGHGVPRIFKSKVKLRVTVCLVLNRSIDRAPSDDKRHEGQQQSDKARTPRDTDGHIKPPNTPPAKTAGHTRQPYKPQRSASVLLTHRQDENTRQTPAHPDTRTPERPTDGLQSRVVHATRPLSLETSSLRRTNCLSQPRRRQSDACKRCIGRTDRRSLSDTTAASL